MFFWLDLNENKVLCLAVVWLPVRDEAVSTQSLRESADGSLVQQSQSSTQFFAHWEVIGCSLPLVCLCLLIVVTPLDSTGAVPDSVVFEYLLHTIRFWNYCRYNYWHYLLDCTKHDHSYFSTQLMDCNNRIQVHRAEKIIAFSVRCLMELGVFWVDVIAVIVEFFDYHLKSILHLILHLHVPL